MMKITYLPFLVAIFTATLASAQDQLPTDADLKSAYCIKVSESRLNNLKTAKAGLPKSLETLADPEIAKVDDLLHRLRSYLSPRLKNLDSTAITAAGNRGTTDMSALRTASDRCFSKCEQSSGVASQKCIQACAMPDIGLNDRMAMCNEARFLPF